VDGKLLVDMKAEKKGQSMDQRWGEGDELGIPVG
jgi:hypothetical protein